MRYYSSVLSQEPVGVLQCHESLFVTGLSTLLPTQAVAVEDRLVQSQEKRQGNPGKVGTFSCMLEYSYWALFGAEGEHTSRPKRARCFATLCGAELHGGEDC